MTTALQKYLDRTTEAAPLAVFRIFFGLMMLISIIRFWAYGWIEKLYLEPKFHFSYYGLEWVKPLGTWTYLLFFICGLAALMVALGFKYRWSVVVFFLSFTYIELMDKTTYLNHYYFISILSFLMIFLPAGAYYSVDAWRDPARRFQFVPNWSLDSVKLLLGIVYFYAGLAKLNSDWLLHAMPLKIWLPSKFDIPLIGSLMGYEWVHYVFSWAGALYDLSIPFLLLYRPTRWFAFSLVVVFHALTRILFPIGMFPYIMIVGTLIFFDARVHLRILGFFSRVLRIDRAVFDNG
ncbi:MAG: HTTM domain-containing protein, partial [Robiginitalea sp.]|nr:HTTM domain-containing protein [Robiginitalea sp.]